MNSTKHSVIDVAGTVEQNPSWGSLKHLITRAKRKMTTEYTALWDGVVFWVSAPSLCLLADTSDYQHTNGQGASNPGAPWSPLSPLTPLLPFLPLSPCEQQRIKKQRQTSVLLFKPHMKQTFVFHRFICQVLLNVCNANNTRNPRFYFILYLVCCWLFFKRKYDLGIGV